MLSTVSKSLIILNNESATWIALRHIVWGIVARKHCSCSVQMQFMFQVYFFLQFVCVCLCMWDDIWESSGHHVCVFMYMSICVLACGGYHVYGCMDVCMWRTEVDVGNHPCWLFNLTHCRRVFWSNSNSQEDPELVDMSILGDQLALGLCCLSYFLRLKLHTGHHTYMAFTWVSGDMNSHPHTQNLLASV